MNPASDIDNEPLTPGEQALAQRLARLGPHGEPSPALDARVLAAAHEAAAHDAARTRTCKPRRQWPVAFGIAASLALAVGIAWQLRPLPQRTAPASTEAPAAMSLPSASDSTPIAQSTTEQATEATDATAIAQQADKTTTVPARSPVANETAAKAARIATPAQPTAPPSPREAQVVLGRSTPAVEAVVPSASATQPPQAFGNLPAPAPPVVGDERRGAAAAADAAGALPETGTLDRLEATGSRDAAASDEPDTDVPPATMTTPEARDAWLARIRELVAAGKSDAARSSLREFRHRYPDAPLPDDLRALGQ